jgi:aryl-alcohol dehydrogenase-like predicted oxidoreductase
VITGATRPEQVIENARAAEWMLTLEEVKEVNEILNS